MANVSRLKCTAKISPMLDEYYAKRGWTSEGIPTAEKLTELGLGEYAKYIQ